ncbi:MAG: glycosyltransferase 87 family protein [Candidatus Limnocylindrales bacterium]
MRRIAGWRYARLVAIAVIVAIGVNSIVWAIADWHLADMHVYQDAALRIRAGEPLYGGDVDSLSAYRYAPWFAYAWVPLTYLPQGMIDFGWSVFLVTGSALAIWASLRGGGHSRVLLALVMAPILFGISAIGNVQGPMLALLMIGLPRRWAGLAVGVAASLKLAPLILALIFLAQRRWWQFLTAVATTTVLWLPAVWMAIDPVTFDSGLARTLPQPLWLAVAAVGLISATALAWKRSRHVTLAAALAAVLAIPRLFVYDISLLLVGTLDPTKVTGTPVREERSG